MWWFSGRNAMIVGPLLISSKKLKFFLKLGFARLGIFRLAYIRNTRVHQFVGTGNVISAVELRVDKVSFPVQRNETRPFRVEIWMNIKRMLSCNEYPNKFLDRCIQQILNRKYGVIQQRDSPAESSPSPK